MSNLFSWINKYKYTFLAVIFLVYICYIFNKGFFTPQSWITYTNILSLVLIMNVLSKTRYTLLLTVLLSFFITFDVYFAYVYHNPVFVGSMASILETNSKEAVEALRNGFINGLIIFILTAFLIFSSEKELKKSKISRKLSLTLLFIYWFVFIPICYTVILNQREGLKAEFKTNPLLTVQRISFSCLPLVYNDIITYISYKQEMFRFKQYGQSERVLPKGIVLDSKLQTPEKIFLVLGESSWQARYSLYGYKHSTTPFLDSLNKNDKVHLKYYNGFSPAPITREALRMVLSFSTPFNMDSFFREKNIVELANDAGYETIWISNQDKIGMYDSYIGFISSGAKVSYFPQSFSREDLELVNTVKNEYKPNKKQFFIIHLLGSHIRYSDRYDDVDRKELTDNGISDNIDYDRTIHHTDRVLREVYRVMKQNASSLVVYFSDHGEKVGLGHGILAKGSSQFEIPYITINNSNVSVDAITSQYIDRNTGLLNSSNSIYILAQILGYNIPDIYKKKAIEDGKYILHINSKIFKYKDILNENK